MDNIKYQELLAVLNASLNLNEMSSLFEGLVLLESSPLEEAKLLREAIKQGVLKTFQKFYKKGLKVAETLLKANKLQASDEKMLKNHLTNSKKIEKILANMSTKKEESLEFYQVFDSINAAVVIESRYTDFIMETAPQSEGTKIKNMLIKQLKVAVKKLREPANVIMQAVNSKLGGKEKLTKQSFAFIILLGMYAPIADKAWPVLRKAAIVVGKK